MPFGEVVMARGLRAAESRHMPLENANSSPQLKKPISIVNLDPANDALPYPCALDIGSLITLKDAMQEHEHGPNGAMLYCMEYLEANLDWLEDGLKALDDDAYVLFDIPGQVELSTNHDSLKHVVQRLTMKYGFRLRTR